MAILKTLGQLLGLVDEPSVRGVWERVGDHFEGCLVEVRSGDEGRIVKMPDKMKSFGWRIADRKWKYITRTGFCFYTIEEMYKAVDKRTGNIFETYARASMELIEDDVIEIIPEDKRIERQQWIRVRNERKADEQGNND